MGRAKVTLKCIEKERVRAQIFKGRANGLMKKMEEFCTKTGVEAFLIVYENNGKSQPMTWPKESEKVCSMIENYEANKIEKPSKNFDLEDFFEIRKSMVQDEISKVRKDILQIKYPTWNQNFNSLDEEHLMKFIALLDTKIIACNQQIGMLKSNQQGRESNFNVGQRMVQSTSVPTNPNPNLNSNQLNFKQSSTPQIQVVPNPNPNPNPNFRLPLYHYNQLATYVDHGFGGSQYQMSHNDPNHVQLVVNNNETSVASLNQVGMQQNNGATVDPTTNDQFGEFMDWTNIGGDGENWANQLNDIEDWTSLESEFQNSICSKNNISSQFQKNVSSQFQNNVSSQLQNNVPQPLNIVPPPIMDEVLIYDYSNNVFQDQPFMNHK